MPQLQKNAPIRAQAALSAHRLAEYRTLEGLPADFINGRSYSGPQWPEDLFRCAGSPDNAGGKICGDSQWFVLTQWAYGECPYRIAKEPYNIVADTCLVRSPRSRSPCATDSDLHVVSGTELPGGRPRRRPCTPQTRFSGYSRSGSRARLVRPRDQSMQGVLRGAPNAFSVEATHNLPVPCLLRDPCTHDRPESKVKTFSGIRRTSSSGMRSRDGI